MNIPTEYTVGHERARLVDSELADRYVAHTLIGDPVMDAIVEELAPLPQDQVHGFIQAGMHGEDMAQAPGLLRAFFESPAPDPVWLDHAAFLPGVYAFQRNSVAVLSAFVTGTLIDGFSTLIAKSFVQTGRIFEDGVRRLKQNNRHQLEIFWPGGLMPYGDGWRLSIRIRFVHAQVRRLLALTEEWDHDAWGVPISAAHLGYAASCFAARTVEHSEALGAQYTPEERAGFHAVWRYSAYLMGIPESILFADEDEAVRIYQIGSLCEPPPSQESIIMTNALINSAPLVAGIEDREQRDKLVNNVIYPVSRALIGNALAEDLKFPSSRLPFALAMYRLDQRLQRIRAILKREGHKNFATLLEASAYDDAGLSYHLPDHAHAERSRRW
ncbi:MAG: oxygenase MpaB family protein [Chloroflexi bacterium]|nr:oxygenase MpaB family protein [Chloroflexota bacterium]